MICPPHKVSTPSWTLPKLWFSRPVLRSSVAERESYLLIGASNANSHSNVVEQRKTRLTAKQALRSDVDWLTEVIRRYSEAYALGLDFSTVNMSNVFRKEKVHQCLYIVPRGLLTCFFLCVVLVEDHGDALCRP